MAVSEEDVRHVARLARLGLAPERIDLLAQELSGILAHMEALGAAPPVVDGDQKVEEPPAVLRPDVGPQLPLDRRREDFAPEMRDGFFLVPRLASHEGEGDLTP